MNDDLRPAATVVVARPGRSPFEVFLVRRPHHTSFMAGAHVFPGGRVDPSDGADSFASYCDGVEQVVPTAPGSPALARAHALAAIRELFEEAGLLLARTADGTMIASSNTAAAALSDARRALHGGTAPFEAICVTHGWRPALDLLVPWSRWMTPSIDTKRFDARFFLAAAPVEQEALHDGLETVASDWLTPREAVDAHTRGEITLAPPTLRTLTDLSSYLTFAAAAAAPTRPADPILPQVFRDDPQWEMLLPGDPRYSGASTIRLSPPTRLVLRDARWHFEALVLDAST